MVNRIILYFLSRPLVAFLVFVAVAAYGAYSWSQLSIEAYPDIADVTSQIITQVPGLAAEEVEQQITVPLERELNGTPGLTVMRSKSTFALSLITVVFNDGAESYWSRQRLLERIATVQLPYGAQPGLDPLTSPIGEIFRYTLESPVRTRRELSELQRWVVMPALKQVAGVADVTNFGGETVQFQVEVDPNKLQSYGLSLSGIADALKKNSASSGGSYLVRGEQAFVVRGIGLVQSLDDLGDIVVSSKRGIPIELKDIGRIQLSAQERNGIVGKDDRPDVISGIVVMLKGENPSRVLDGIHAKVAQINGSLLPSDVQVVPYLDRSHLVDATIRKVGTTALEGIVLVSLVVMIFLGSLRCGLIVALTIPFAMFFAFALMKRTDIPANLLSLGAIDFGILVDGAIVVVENIIRRRETDEDGVYTLPEAASAVLEVGRPVFFAKLIIITAYLPLFALERVEGKLFQPMAYAIGYSLLGALIAALIVVPAFAYVTVKGPLHFFRNRPLDWLTVRYQRLLTYLVRTPATVLAGLAIATLLTIALGLTVKREFLPELDEGSIWLQVNLPPGISLDAASAMAGQLRQAVREFGEVSYVVTQTGRNDDGTDPWTPSHIEASVGLKPYATWASGRSKRELIDAMRTRLDRLPGMEIGFSQPMIDGVYDKLSGAHSQMVVKIYGDDLTELRSLTEKIRSALLSVPGAIDVAIDQEPPLAQVQVTPDRERIAREGINVEDVAQLVNVGIGGGAVGQVYIGDKYYDVTLRIAKPFRDSPEKLAQLSLPNADGAYVPLGQLADIGLKQGESTITREMNRRHLTIRLNYAGDDLTGFLEQAKHAVASVPFDRTRFDIAWGGQFENQSRAEARLAVVLPMVLGLMALLLFVAFGNLRHVALVMLTVPLAVFGGLSMLELRGYALNVATIVGFIALFGVAVQAGVIMVANLNRHAKTAPNLEAAVVAGAVERLRATVLIALVAALGMTPAAFATGIGSDIQRLLGTVIVGGTLVATALTLIALPVLYYVVERRIARSRGGMTDALEEAA
ncbi:MAG TPA: CusA/CzcA family heavy metal efflux RND transporter [Pseudomonadales bacterium]|nr:CusA/CzcA family heavy metal efflux RND transporter [Pseudomonadales bacterium]